MTNLTAREALSNEGFPTADIDAILAALDHAGYTIHRTADATIARSADGLIWSLDGIHPPDERLKPFYVYPAEPAE